MKMLRILIICATALSLVAAPILLLDETGQPMAYLPRADTSKYIGMTNAIINPVMPPGVPVENLKIVNGQIRQKTAGEIQAGINRRRNEERQARRRAAKEFLTDTNVFALIYQAQAEFMFDQINAARAEINILRSREGLEPIPMLTMQNLRQAIAERIDAKP